jgi:putative membrane protein
LGVRLPTSVPTKYQVAASSLSQLSGQAFDSAFLDEGGVNSHLEAASVFQREAAFGNNPDLLAVANRGLNIIGQHFALASQLTDYRFAQVPRRYTGQTALEGSGTPNQ